MLLRLELPAGTGADDGLLAALNHNRWSRTVKIAGDLLHELTLAETHHLTGARTRAAGLADLGHEIDRARRSNGHLIVSYIDVVDLKAVNDTYGHMAGDELLQRW
jgi:GGDEF domain-containing protein